MKLRLPVLAAALLLIFTSAHTVSGKDVIRVMCYNVLHYGDECQGDNTTLHNYLKTIVRYANPDILGLEKVAAIPTGAKGKQRAPVAFADSILVHALNGAFADRYAKCPFTNHANDNDQCLLFYNKHKLGFVSLTTLTDDESDFNLYKLYYLDPNLSHSHDTAFLYIILNHTNSGDKPDDRNRQIAKVMKALRKHFDQLPAVITMGDFNLRSAEEDGYQELVNSGDAHFHFSDPPFALDKDVAYPANWEKHPERFARFLTTSTRKKKSEPNSCGTGGGAKAWYDHIFLSDAITNNRGTFSYKHHSYRTIGNDGRRIDASVNDVPNDAAPKEVLDALYHFSNKYPVMLELNIK